MDSKTERSLRSPEEIRADLERVRQGIHDRQFRPSGESTVGKQPGFQGYAKTVVGGSPKGEIHTSVDLEPAGRLGPHPKR